MAKHGAERRKHKRHDIPCPVKILDSEGGLLAKSKCQNISDGGILVPLPPTAAGKMGANVQIEISVPRTTPNTYMLEQFSSMARVIRTQDTDSAGIAAAFEFARPLNLAIEV